MRPRMVSLDLRLAWLLLLSSTVLVFAYPALFFVIAGDRYDGERLAVHDAWSWDWQVWLAPLAAMALPRLAPASYASRLAAAAVLCFPAWWVLLQTSFLEPFGCVHPPFVRTVPEHLGFACLLAGALLSHPPRA